MKSVVGLALALWMSTTISTASASLITNGDFETGDAKFKVTARFAGAGSVDPMNIALNAGA